MADLRSYTWLVVVGALAAFLFGFGTGSNDVANAFGTAVGAKSVTLRQAVVIATIFEFSGAMVLGRVSTATIAGGIADINAFRYDPEAYAYGMCCALTVAGLWQVASSYMELNTSSTHSIIGCIIGFSLVYAGGSGVLWARPDPTSFPPWKGIVPIIASWFISPLLCAASSATLFILLRYFVLTRRWAYRASFWILPFLVTLTVFVCLFFVFTKGAKKAFEESSDWDDKKSLWVAALVAAGCGGVCAALMPLLMRQADRKFGIRVYSDSGAGAVGGGGEGGEGPPQPSPEAIGEAAATLGLGPRRLSVGLGGGESALPPAAMGGVAVQGQGQGLGQGQGKGQAEEAVGAAAVDIEAPYSKSMGAVPDRLAMDAAGSGKAVCAPSGRAVRIADSGTAMRPGLDPTPSTPFTPAAPEEAAREAGRASSQEGGRADSGEGTPQAVGGGAETPGRGVERGFPTAAEAEAETLDANRAATGTTAATTATTATTGATTGDDSCSVLRPSAAPTPSRSSSTEWLLQALWYAGTKVRYAGNKVAEVVMYGTSVDVHQVIEDDPIIAKLHKHARVYDSKVEYVFQHLQVFSACCVMLAHGAGEVGYLSGPLGAIWHIVNEGTIVPNITAPAWVVVIGACGLVAGLALYGYNVVRAMGVRLAKLSPTRGFCAELSTALVILVASQYGLPTSSSQVITGGIVGVGLCEGILGVNWNFFALQFSSWVGTLFICGVGTAALFSMGAFAPSIQASRTVRFYEQRIADLTQQLASATTTSLNAHNGSTAAFVLSGQPGSNSTLALLQGGSQGAKAGSGSGAGRGGGGEGGGGGGGVGGMGGGTGGAAVKSTAGGNLTLQGEAADVAAAAKAQAGPVVQTADPDLLVQYLYRALALYQQSSCLPSQAPPPAPPR